GTSHNCSSHLCDFFYDFFWKNYSYDYNESRESFSPDPDTLECGYEPLEPTAVVILCVIFTVISVLAIFGNLLVGWVIRTSQEILAPSDVYLFQLTIADGLLALTLQFCVAALTRGWLLGDFLCQLLHIVMDANFYTSIIFLTCISIDRYLVIVGARETLKSHQKMCSRILCTVVWVLGCALALSTLSIRFDISTAWRLAIQGFIRVFGFFVPAIVMISCYSITVSQLLLTHGFQKHRAMRVIVTIVVAFLLLWTPYQITMVIDILLRADLVQHDCDTRRLLNTALVATHCLALLHSCINPFLYVAAEEKLRKKMKLRLCTAITTIRITVTEDINTEAQ
uniref:G-protein coupled receptors family 1 profile domain-containing protein n=1 Tax=Pundamilia nyererei TaxID=303518 RepID=A0A3B4FIS5_9CICH